MASVKVAGHGKLHKRGNSGSSMPSVGPHNFTFGRPDSPFATHDEPFGHAHLRLTPNVSGATPKIKPYLRKISLKDSDPSLDLDTDSLAGLGIHDFGATPRSVSDVTFAHAGRRGGHNRSTSINSQYSSSSAQRPTQYVHPMRQTPRPYTPPVIPSYPTSVVDSEENNTAEASDILSEDDYWIREQERQVRQRQQEGLDISRRSTSFSSHTPTPLRIQTTGGSSSSGLRQNSSFTNLSMKNLTRPRGNTNKSIDTYTTSPSSRTSMESKPFPFHIRSRGNSIPLDPADQDAKIAAARQDFREKQAAKDRKADEKAEKDALKQAEREHRKRHKLEKHHPWTATPPTRSMEIDRDNGRARKKSVSDAEKRAMQADQMTLQSVEYENINPVHDMSLPARVEKLPEDQGYGYQATHLSKKKKARSRYQRFKAWLKTRFARLTRSKRVSSK